MRTVSPIFVGGFGNRLYQLANIFRLQKKFNFNTKFYRIKSNENDVLNFRSLVLRASDFDDFGGHELIRKEGLPSNITEIFPSLNWENRVVTINEILQNKILFFENNINSISPHDDSIIAGYFFGYSFIEDSIESVRDSFNPSILKYIQVNYSDLFNKKILGIHLRMGISSDNNSALVIPHEFYQKIINDEISEFDEIFIISDNPKKSLDFISNLNFYNKKIKIIQDEPMFIDLFILSLCKIIIIAPSTLSAWSSYLSKDSKIYVPKIWTSHHWTTDVPKTWRLL
jgi:hypothetical protein